MRMDGYADVGASNPASILGVMGVGGSAPADNVRAFWRRVERFAPGAEVRQHPDAAPGKQLIVISGWACDLRILPDGRRQIFSFLLPGDAIEPRDAGSVGSRGVIALTRLEVVDSGRQLAADEDHRDLLVLALRTAALRREERLYDHLVRMGRLTAKERVIHLLLELRERLERVGLLEGDTFKIPLTQEIFADSLGLSVVHINRTLKGLRREGSICIKSGEVTVRDPAALAKVSCYVSPYAQSDPARRLTPMGQPGHGSRTFLASRQHG
jgi:CRP-like cAMP-binding protein